jgi:SAM-dependent methyltransferase
MTREARSRNARNGREASRHRRRLREDILIAQEECQMNASLYDFINGFSERRIVGPLRRELIARIHGEIVDVGAGTGANFPFYPADAHVLALEPDSSMARRAQARVPSATARIELRVADDRYLDTLAPESFDAVVLTLVLCSVQNPTATLRRVRHVLKRDGILILIEHVRSAGNVGRFQDIVTPIWRLCGNCHLNRHTGATAAAAGFDTTPLRIKRLPKLSPIQEIIYGNLRVRTPASA